MSKSTPLKGVVMRGYSAVKWTLKGRGSASITKISCPCDYLFVKTREIVYLLFKQPWAPLLPILQGLNGREMA